VVPTGVLLLEGCVLLVAGMRLFRAQLGAR